MKKQMISHDVALKAETINAAATVSSSPIQVGYAENFSYIAIISGTTPDLKLEVQITDSQQGDATNIGSIHDGQAQWYTPSTGGILVANLTASRANGFTPAVSKWIRMRVTGNGGNGADTKITLIVMYQ